MQSKCPSPWRSADALFAPETKQDLMVFEYVADRRIARPPAAPIHSILDLAQDASKILGWCNVVLGLLGLVDGVAECSA